MGFENSVLNPPLLRNMLFPCPVSTISLMWDDVCPTLDFVVYFKRERNRGQKIEDDVIRSLRDK